MGGRWFSVAIYNTTPSLGGRRLQVITRRRGVLWTWKTWRMGAGIQRPQSSATEEFWSFRDWTKRVQPIPRSRFTRWAWDGVSPIPHHGPHHSIRVCTCYQTGRSFTPVRRRCHATSILRRTLGPAWWRRQIMAVSAATALRCCCR